MIAKKRGLRQTESLPPFVTRTSQHGYLAGQCREFGVNITDDGNGFHVRVSITPLRELRDGLQAAAMITMADKQRPAADKANCILFESDANFAGLLKSIAAANPGSACWVRGEKPVMVPSRSPPPASSVLRASLAAWCSSTVQVSPVLE